MTFLMVFVCLSDLFAASTYEADAFIKLMQGSKPIFDKKSIFIFDRLYSSLNLIEHLENSNVSYVIRVPRNNFKDAQKMFDDPTVQDHIVTIGGHKVRLLRIELA